MGELSTPFFTPIFSWFSLVISGFYMIHFEDQPRIYLTSTGYVPQITHSKPEPRWLGSGGMPALATPTQ
jgi:hypothetical protein